LIFPSRRFGYLVLGNFKLIKPPDSYYGATKNVVDKFVLGKKQELKQRIAHIALVVDDYDEAIAFYTKKLDFLLIEDTKLSEEKRCILVAPKGAKECCLLLAKAADKRQEASIGNQTGGRVFLFLFTDDFWRDYHKMLDRGIKFVRQPEQLDYGMVAVFKDLYGNMWDLLEPNENNKGVLD
jgi:catechol 2,3-dioxygenase-like lactoylglutathione lyase family enzyme